MEDVSERPSKDEGKIYSGDSHNPFLKPNFISKTLRDSYLDPDTLLNPWNPDDLYQKDQSYRLYEEMVQDDQVNVALQLKKDLVLSTGWDIVASESEQEDIQHMLEQSLQEDPRYAFEEMLEEMLSAYEFGFSVTEKIFKVKDDGFLTLDCLKTRHPGPWIFETDPSGDITKYEQWVNEGTIEIPASSLIHYINGRKFQNPYGTSDLRAAYQAWFTKKHITRFYAIFLEKAASPVPIGQYEMNSTSESERTKLYNALQKFQAKSALLIPKGFQVDFLEAKSNGEAYIKGINLFNMFIGRSLLIPDLLGFQGAETGGGSYALGKDQIGVFFKHIRRRRSLIERVVNQHIIYPLVVYNYGFQESYPKFKLKEISNDEAMESVDKWIELTKTHGYKATVADIKHFKSIINFPFTEEDELNEEENEDLGEDKESKENEEIGEDKERSAGSDEEESPEIPLDDDSNDSNDSKFSKKNYKFSPPGGDFARKTNFKALEAQLDSALTVSQAKMKPIIDEIYADLYEQLQKKKIVEKQDLSKMDSIKIRKTDKLKKLLRSEFKALYEQSFETAKSEIVSPKIKFAAGPIVDEKFIEIIDQELLEYIGDWEYRVSQGARVAVTNAIKDGKPISSVISILDEDSKRASEVSTERYARTKFTEIMNKGRVNMFEKSGVVNGYQYSAILDDRVTDICRGLHGKKFKAGSQPVPPMHFNAIVEGSSIKTLNGDIPIEDIEVGDLVLTHLGNWMPVYDVMSKFEDKDFYEIELENGKILKATGEHPVLTDSGWVRVDELNESDDIMCLEDINNLRSIFNVSLVDSQYGIAAVI